MQFSVFAHKVPARHLFAGRIDKYHLFGVHLYISEKMCYIVVVLVEHHLLQMAAAKLRSSGTLFCLKSFMKHAGQRPSCPGNTGHHHRLTLRGQIRRGANAE